MGNRQSVAGTTAMANPLQVSDAAAAAAAAAAADTANAAVASADGGVGGSTGALASQPASQPASQQAAVEITASSASNPRAAAEEARPVGSEAPAQQTMVTMPSTDLEHRLNNLIGHQWWRKYVAAYFWSCLSTPISFAIVVLAALSTGQAFTAGSGTSTDGGGSSSGGGFLSAGAYKGVALALLVLTSINNFFRPHSMMISNIAAMDKWEAFGRAFEDAHFKYEDDMAAGDAAAAIWARQATYGKLKNDINEYEASIETENEINFTTDAIYGLSCLLLRKHKEDLVWIDLETSALISSTGTCSALWAQCGRCT